MTLGIVVHRRRLCSLWGTKVRGRFCGPLELNIVSSESHVDCNAATGMLQILNRSASLVFDSRLCGASESNGGQNSYLNG